MKISIVTPAYNMEMYISETIKSVIEQRGDFDVEYILVNDGSTDRTEDIVLDLQKKLASGDVRASCRSFELRYFHQENQGMYSAINNGFSIATGDIFAWIGGDDVYRPDTAFDEIVKWFLSHPKSSWVKGMCGLIDKDGKKIRDGRHRAFYRDWLVQGIYGRESYFVEQECVFWKPSLWKKVAPIPTRFRSAGDYWLWIQFAKHAELESLPIQVAYFRIRPGQISSNKTKYRKEQEDIAPHRSMVALVIRFFSILSNRLRFLRPFLAVIYSAVFPKRKFYS